MKAFPLFLVLVGGAAWLSATQPATAAPTAEQRKELADIREEATKAASLVRRKQVDEAEKILDECEARLQKIVGDTGFPENDRAVMSLQRLIMLQRQSIAQQKGDAKPGEGGVSFLKDVAPILKDKCGNCHSNNPRANLRLDTFAGMKQGGASGPLLTVGNPTRSLLIAKLTAPPNQRMPRNAPALSTKEIQTISLWITQGAKFDGDDENAPFAAATPNQPAKPKPAVTVARPTGGETVSFSKDIAPFMVNLCVRCHSGNNPRSGFSLETFEKLLQGGDSGRVVIPGNIDGSRMWDLVGKQDPIKMPPGQLLITRTNWNNLRTWIEEGAKFDGDDPKKPIRELVPTEDQLRAQELAKLTPAEFAARRLKRTQEQWERVLPKEEPKSVESGEFIVFGNVSEARLKEIDGWAVEHAKALRTLFNDKAELLWKGKLAIIVFKDRFGYEEFNLVIENGREAPREMIGHAKVVPSFEDAYVALQDVGDGASSESPGLQISLIDHLTGAYLQRSSGKLPEWILRGTGLAMAGKASPGNPYIQGLHAAAQESVQTLEKPDDVFRDGVFSPSDTGSVGYTLVEFLLKAGGGPKFGQLIKSLQGGANIATAVKDIYGTDLAAVATAYFAGFKNVRKPK
jgi:hypothetical protein